MAGSLGGRTRRVRRLEATTGGGDRCPECGFDGNYRNASIVVEWYDEEGTYDGPEETVYCETCGEPTDIVVTWQDLLRKSEAREERQG